MEPPAHVHCDLVQQQHLGAKRQRNRVTFRNGDSFSMAFFCDLVRQQHLGAMRPGDLLDPGILLLVRDAL